MQYYKIYMILQSNSPKSFPKTFNIGRVAKICEEGKMESGVLEGLVGPGYVGRFVHENGFVVFNAIAYAEVVILRVIKDFKFCKATVVGLATECVVRTIAVFYRSLYLEVFDQHIVALLSEQAYQALAKDGVVK